MACRRNRRCVAGSSSLLGGGAIAWRDHRRAEAQLAKQEEPQSVPWRAKASHYRPFIERVIAQSERRMLKGEQVPAAEKLVSLFDALGAGLSISRLTSGLRWSAITLPCSLAWQPLEALAVAQPRSIGRRRRFLLFGSVGGRSSERFAPDPPPQIHEQARIAQQ